MFTEARQDNILMQADTNTDASSSEEDQDNKVGER